MAHQQRPERASYDIVIVGGAIMGASVAWFLTEMSGFDGRILVIERDASYKTSSTIHTTSCMRQQFSGALNIRISQFAADFVKNLRAHMGGDPRVPELSIHNFGYMYLAQDDAAAQALRDAHQVQIAEGAATRLMTPAQIAAEYPFYQTEDIVLGSINTVDEGYWDATAVFDWWRRSGQERGVAYIENEVVAITRDGARVTSVTLKSGEEVGCGQVINASGPRALRTAQMAGLHIPVEPRKRYSWVFRAERPLAQDLPLTIDPSGVHVRENGGGTYQAGGHGADDPAVAYNDFAMDHSLWQEHIWPVLAHRIPQFEAIKVIAEWAGHYAYNTFDHNAILGPHPEVTNFLFLNGFSGHGLQQSPAMGRGLAEWIVHGEYRTLDLSPFHFDRIAQGRPLVERAII
ncbi:glycine/D-amino acid oxidase-like deaminating enzyme [Rubricella aquisinus]|uniref:Glycine/D-amino acid oxidase-like deaminating enzyme n=1 Tax=Rubricella aquisinus TaxID=2028108 RepID=A0A840WIN3_9RHOB|nr:FAD-binding oxidoreductase [Rubricella aquisinus]MBB5514978.1 glycine/D-amino acid oxidase-like deaminating enzyme [Rubricella aquisinus]